MKDIDDKAAGARRDEEARKPFEVPRITRRDSLPVITAGSVNLW